MNLDFMDKLEAMPKAPAAKPVSVSPATGWRFSPIDSAAFDAGDYRCEWLVNRLLVRGMPAVIGGPSKSLKTSVAVDLAISLGTKTAFLDRFIVPHKRRVAFVSGESGEATLQETARRICSARGVRLADANLLWQTSLPQLCNPEDVDELSKGIEREGVEVIGLDPLYLMLLAGVAQGGPRAENLLEIGPLLRSIGTACTNAGATPFLLHHTRKTVSRDPLELTDLAYSGIGEYARQWVLLNRRERYTGDGIHKLWLGVGGSNGQGGEWGVDIEEGILREDFTGRVWRPTVTARGEMHDEQERNREQVKSDRDAKKLEKDKKKLFEAVEKLTKITRLAIPTNARDSAGLSQPRFRRALDSLIEEKALIEEERDYTSGAGNKSQRKGKGIRLTTASEKGLFE